MMSQSILYEFIFRRITCWHGVLQFWKNICVLKMKSFNIYLIEVVFVVHLVDRTHQIFDTLKAEVNFWNMRFTMSAYDCY